MLLFNLLTSASSSVQGNEKNPMMWIILGVFAVVLIVMMVLSNRSNKKRQKEAEEKLNNMRVGDKVKTIGGICGVVVEINDAENTFVLETGVENKGSLIKFDKVAVYQTSHPEDEAAPAEAPVAEAAEEAPAEAPDEAAPAEEAAAEVAENAEKAE
ncbi:MAG: preprotein translocase subunit YajC [Clostridia bacterium]|nr:preprotein translocase subunit YajC [Clostridia bacterium]